MGMLMMEVICIVKDLYWEMIKMKTFQVMMKINSL